MVCAVPLRVRTDIIGAMNLFRGADAPFTEVEMDIAQAMAEMAVTGLLQERARRERSLLAEQLQSALDSRVVIEQAKGVVAQRYGVGMDEAFSLLRTYCRNTHQRLNEVARLIVADGSRIPDLSAG